MPELPDITVYIEALEQRILGKVLLRATVLSPFLLRTAEPPLDDCQGRRVVALRRIGKRIAIGLDGDLWLVLHLMIAGRLHWIERGAKPARAVLARFEFESGTLTLTEAGTRRRASLHVVRAESGLCEQDPGGAELATLSPAEFAERLTSENHTLKRALTDPRLFSGIGNAYSDEILHAARLSPLLMTGRMTPPQIESLRVAILETLDLWTRRLREEAGESFPERVTAFRKQMAVHGRYGKPCPDCGTSVQRIRYADNETNYCPRCQTEGRVLADRALSRLLKSDWPRSIEELEKRRQA